MPFDYKKECRAFYQPPKVPEIIDVPEMQFVCVSGTGDPNEEGGAYQQALGVLYAVSYTLKMSPRAGHLMDGFFDYVVPPLEGFWQQDGVSGVDYGRKADFRWLSVIRVPDFVTRRISAGRWKRRQKRRSWTAPALNCARFAKDFVCR